MNENSKTKGGFRAAILSMLSAVKDAFAAPFRWLAVRQERAPDRIRAAAEKKERILNARNERRRLKAEIRRQRRAERWQRWKEFWSGVWAYPLRWYEIRQQHAVNRAEAKRIRLQARTVYQQERAKRRKAWLTWAIKQGRRFSAWRRERRRKRRAKAKKRKGAKEQAEQNRNLAWSFVAKLMAGATFAFSMWCAVMERQSPLLGAIGKHLLIFALCLLILSWRARAKGLWAGIKAGFLKNPLAIVWISLSLAYYLKDFGR